MTDLKDTLAALSEAEPAAWLYTRDPGEWPASPPVIAFVRWPLDDPARPFWIEEPLYRSGQLVPVPSVVELIETLAWYGEQARLARLIHSEGDAGRHALQADGGKKARAFIAAMKWEGRGDV